LTRQSGLNLTPGSRAHAVLPIAGKGGSDWSYAPVPTIGPLLAGTMARILLRFLGL